MSRIRYLLIGLALTSVMAFALACGEDEAPAAPAAPAAAAPAAAAGAAPEPAAPAQQPAAPAAAAPAAPAQAPVALVTTVPTAVPVIAAATVAPVVQPAAGPGAVEHIKMAQSDDTNSVHCPDTSTVPSVLFQKNFCDGSIDFVQDVLTGRLATSWSSNADSTEWTYKLRQGVEFHNGDPFNAQALKADLVLKMTNEDPLGDFNRGIYQLQIDSVDVVDEFTVRLNMKKSRPIWPLDETWWSNGVTNVSALEEVGLEAYRENPVGTGAYKFLEWDRLIKVRMEANRDWWGPEVNTMPELATVFTIPEPATRMAALLTDEIQWLINPLIPQIETIEASDNHYVLLREQYDVNMMRLNWFRQPVLKERRLRQAISESINYQAIVDDIFQGTARVLLNHLPTTSSYYDPNDEPFPKYDPENAKALVAALKSEGLYDDEPIEFMGPRGVYSEDVRVVQAMVEMMKDAGINAEAAIVDSAIRTERTQSQKCDWDLTLWLPVDGYGDMQGWLWQAAGGRPGTSSWCFKEDPVGSGDWGDPFLNNWMEQGLAAESLPIGPGRDAAWLEAVSNFNQAYIHQGLYQVFFVYGISNEWDFVADSHETVFVWAFTKR